MTDSLTRLPAHITGHWAEVDGTPIRWFERRGDGDPILLLHGGGANSAWWFNVVPSLDGRWLLLMDFSGHGDSGHRAAYSVRQWADEVEAVITASTADSVQLVAHSMGGRAATVVAARPNSRVVSLVLVDCVIPTLSTEPMPSPEPQRVYASREEALARFRFTPAACAADEATRRQIAVASVIERNGGWRWKFDPRVFAMTDPEVVNESISRITLPVAVIQAAESEVTTRENAAQLSRDLGCQPILVDFPGVGHHPMIEDPDRTAGILEDVLRRLQAPRLKSA